VRSLGVAVQRRHPQYNERARVRARRLLRAAGVRVPRGVCISVSNLGIQCVKGRGPSSADPLIGGDSRYGAKRKGLVRGPGPLMSEVL